MYVVRVGSLFDLCWQSSRRRFKYWLGRCGGPLGCCIGRVVVGVEGSMGFGEVSFWGNFGMSVVVAVFFPGTGFILTVAFPLNLYFR